MEVAVDNLGAFGSLVEGDLDGDGREADLGVGVVGGGVCVTNLAIVLVVRGGVDNGLVGDLAVGSADEGLQSPALVKVDGNIGDKRVVHSGESLNGLDLTSEAAPFLGSCGESGDGSEQSGLEKVHCS